MRPNAAWVDCSSPPGAVVGDPVLDVVDLVDGPVATREPAASAVAVADEPGQPVRPDP